MSRTQILAIISGVVLLVMVLELVRRRRLREEYSWIWLLTAIGYLTIAAVPRLIERGAVLLGSVRPTSVFTFLGLFFLFLVSIQFSVQISRLAEQTKDLAQQIAILDSEIRRLSRSQDGGANTPSSMGEGLPTEPSAPASETGDGEDHAQRADD